MTVDPKYPLTRQDRINLVLLAMFFIGLNKAIVPDGEVGQEAKRAIENRRTKAVALTDDQTNFLILALKAAGCKDDLRANGIAGNCVHHAEQAFLSADFGISEPSNPDCLSVEEKVNFVLLAMKIVGLNKRIKADGVAGEQLWIAEKTFMEFQDILALRQSDSSPA